ncbi:MAG: NTP transferase domain-containing protein [Thermoanaerobaculia bacterium]|nr:NTP transferase domain-containing protein [Thermoanaerobaculia bacterium]
MSGSVAGVILAAGPSRRFGGLPKPLLEVEGRPLVLRLLEQAAASRLSDLFVVVGHQAERLAPLLAGWPLSVVECSRWRDGQSASVRAGLAALPADAAAAMFLPVDQPRLTTEVIDRLIARYHETGGPVVVPVHRGRRGSPVIFDASLFGELRRITGDEGGRQLFAAHEAEIVELELPDPEPLEDVDTPEEYARLTGRPPPAANARPATENAMFHIDPPSRRDEIVAALASLRGEIAAYFHGLPPEAFVAPQGPHWAPEGHLRHLTKSVRPVAAALRRSRLVLGLLFGRGRSDSRAFDEVVEVYREALGQGAQAGRYAPSRREELPPPEEWQRTVVEGWQTAGRELERAIGGWSEGALDRYRLPHPLLGKMTVREILFFTLYHNAHHARRVHERFTEAPTLEMPTLESPGGRPE